MAAYTGPTVTDFTHSHDSLIALGTEEIREKSPNPRDCHDRRPSIVEV